jgi:hypothetical protein
MTGLQIYEQILACSDAELLQSFPTEQRLACSQCGSVSIRQLADTATTGVGTCSHCKQRQPVRMATYYPKQRTTSPEFAVANHRSFWTQKYYQVVCEQKLHINPYHPVPDPLSAYRTQQELDLLKATCVFERFVLEIQLAAPEQPAEGPTVEELTRRLDRCQGILDADSYWRGQGQLSETGQLSYLRFANPKAAVNWAHGILVQAGKLTGEAPYSFAEIAAEAHDLSS